MTDIAVIILTKDEKLHIGRCLDRLVPLEPRQIFVVDCYSTDGTQDIVVDSSTSKIAETDQSYCPRIPASVVEHEWPGNQAAQFNWALDNLAIDTEWILRLDADEWLTDELISEIKDKVQTLPKDVDGVVFKRRHYVGWLGSKWIKHGMYPTRILRLFRTGYARYAEDMAMDEHLVVKGKTVEFNNDFVDESLISFGDWKAKHRNYVKREAMMAISGKMNPNKRAYYRLPPYFRAIVYFCIRYFLKLGFLDGLAGFRSVSQARLSPRFARPSKLVFRRLRHFSALATLGVFASPRVANPLKGRLRQGLWYRWIVDREIGRMKRGLGN